MINVLVVDDSTFMRKVITQLITRDPEINVIATAGDGQEALEKKRQFKPDVITMDVIMPMPDGLWTLEEVMKQDPTPIIIVSSVAGKQSDVVEIAYSLGVFDVVQKPFNPNDIALVAQELITKIKAAAKMDKTRLLSRLLTPAAGPVVKGIKQKATSVVVIGSSAGGPVALDEVLPKIPPEFPSGIIVAQHMPQEFLTSYVKHLEKKCVFPIKIAEDGDLVLQKRILFSPGNATLELSRIKKGVVVRITKPDVRMHPDIDTTFASCAEAFQNQTIAVVLSGMGQYGVTGIRALRQAGGKVISEAEFTATVYGMPKAINTAGLADWILPSYQITEALVELLAGRKPAEPAGQEEFFVKGIILKKAIEYLTKTAGNEGFQVIVKLLSDQSRQAIQNGFSLNLCYSGKVYLEFYQKIYDLIGKTNARILQDLGALEARTVHDLSKQSAFIKIEAITDLTHFMPKLLSTVFWGISGEMVELRLEDRHVGFKFRGPMFRQEAAMKIIRETMTGWIKELFKSFVQGELKIGFVNESDDKGTFCKCFVDW